MRAFRLTAENAELFFEICQSVHANTEEERLQVLDAMVQLGRVEQITDTPKTKEEYIKHLAKNFKVGVVEYKGSIGFSPTKSDDPKGDTSNGTN